MESSHNMSRRAFLTMAGATALSLACSSLSRSNGIFSAESDNVLISASGDSTIGFNLEHKLRQIEREQGLEKALDYPYEKVKEYHAKSDIAITNLEGTFTEFGKKYPKKFNFKGSPKYAGCLNEGNVDIVNVANNHIFDFYARGARDTLEVLNERGIMYCGGGLDKEDASYKIIEKKGVRVAFLGVAQVCSYSMCKSVLNNKNPVTINAYYSEKFKREVRNAKDDADVVVVSCHAGTEKIAFPSNYQKRLGKEAVDAGADVVLMHHPHVLQGIQRYDEGVIFYSLGNFAFGGNKFPRDRDSMIAQIEVSKGGLVDFSVLPVITHPDRLEYQPFVPPEKEQNRIIKKIEKRSAPFYKDKIKNYLDSV